MIANPWQTFLSLSYRVSTLIDEGYITAQDFALYFNEDISLATEWIDAQWQIREKDFRREMADWNTRHRQEMAAMLLPLAKSWGCKTWAEFSKELERRNAVMPVSSVPEHIEKRVREHESAFMNLFKALRRANNKP